jgi:hypothetical protein
LLGSLTKKRHTKLYVCCSYSDLYSVQSSEAGIVTCSYELCISVQYIQSPIQTPSIITLSRDNIYIYIYIHTHTQKCEFRRVCMHMCMLYVCTSYVSCVYIVTCFLGSRPIQRFVARQQLCKYATILQALLGSLSQKVKVKVTLRLTVGQSVILGVEPHMGLMTRYLFLFDSYGLVFVGRPL